MKESKVFTRTILAIALFIAAFTLSGPRSGSAQDATIELDIGKITFLVGGSAGFGQLYFRGQAYQLAVGGVTAGATVSFSRANLVGNVYNLANPADIEGIYSAGTAGLAAAAGGAVVTLTNSRGVTMTLTGRQLGLDASLDLSGMRITLR
jgi:hypothetical protein